MNTSIGERLRKARQSRALSLEEVSLETYMHVRYLAALEAGNLEAMPSQAQARGFLRAYADYLGLDGEALLSELDQEEAQPLEAETIPEKATPPPISDATEDRVKQIFSEIGQALKKQRDLLGLSLEDISQHTHLRRKYLQDIEQGELDELPSPVQGRGMLNNYASFVGLDPEPLLLQFAEALQLRLVARQKQDPRKSTRKRIQTVQGSYFFRRVFNRETIFTILTAVFLLAFMIWGVLQILESAQPTQAAPTPPSIADVLLASPTITETPTPAEPSPTFAPQATLENLQETPLAITPITTEEAQAASVQVYVTVRQRAWMRVTVDGKVEFEGRVQPGSAYQYGGKQQVEILTGNGAALQVFFQGQDLGPMGNFGQVVDRVYTIEGVLMPTETITPTPTETPIPSPTPRQTATPTSTPSL
jgi:cytoskeleton protein RodZ